MAAKKISFAINSNSISQYYCFYCVFDQVYATLVSVDDFFQKVGEKVKILPTPNF